MFFGFAVLPPPAYVTTYFPFSSHSTILREFLQDASRAGTYVVDAEAYTSASLNCLKYLSRFHLGAPINIHHTQRNLARRRNSPWHWRQHMGLISGAPILRDFLYNGFPKNRCYRLDYSVLTREFRPLYKRAKRQRMYMDATYIALVFLRRALPRSAKSEELVAFIKADKSFSQRAMQFPTDLKKCKAAIAAYLARVQSGE